MYQSFHYLVTQGMIFVHQCAQFSAIHHQNRGKLNADSRHCKRMRSYQRRPPKDVSPCNCIHWNLRNSIHPQCDLTTMYMKTDTVINSPIQTSMHLRTQYTNLPLCRTLPVQGQGFRQTGCHFCGPHIWHQAIDHFPNDGTGYIRV